MLIILPKRSNPALPKTVTAFKRTKKRPLLKPMWGMKRNAISIAPIIIQKTVIRRTIKSNKTKTATES